MRCLALAQAWQEQSGQVTFATLVTLPPALRARLETEQLAHQTIHAEPGNDEDARLTIAVAQAISAGVVVVDGYHFGADYQRHIKNAGLSLLFIDDYGHAEHYTADWVLNQNVYAEASLYESREPYIQLLLGTRYALLRREFWGQGGQKQAAPLVARKILVTMGGSDPDNVTHKVLKALEQVTLDGLEITVVIGGSNPYREQLQSAASTSRHKIQVANNVADMPALMADIDLAISAGGTTVWELALMAVPTVILILADNQRRTAEKMDSLGAAVNLGTAETSEIETIADVLSRLLVDQTARQHMVKMGHTLVDGQGAARVVERLMAGALGLRAATTDDAQRIWEWANDPVTRANSFNSQPIPWENHLAWYGRKLKSPDTRFWLLEQGGIPVASIRYDRLEGDTALISYMVDAGHRGQGLGTHLLALSFEKACAEMGVARLRGITFADNKASARAFEKAGYTLVQEAVIDDQPSLVFERTCGE